MIERLDEGEARYREIFRRNVALVTTLFAETSDLLQFHSGSALAADPQLVRPARYLSGPPVSADDLNTLADASIATRKRLDADLAKRAAAIIESALDRERFPWLFEEQRRTPTADERATAIRWTAGLQTVQEYQTGRRSESSARQEAAVEELLRGEEFRKVDRRPISVVGGLAPGEFSREAEVQGPNEPIKCDVPVGLRDGRFLFIECKVSNSATNSVKRLNREVRGKARQWRDTFGERAITAAVLAGVYKLRNLKDAQAAGVAIFWEHDLQPLAEFLRMAA